MNEANTNISDDAPNFIFVMYVEIIKMETFINEKKIFFFISIHLKQANNATKTQGATWHDENEKTLEGTEKGEQGINLYCSKTREERELDDIYILYIHVCVCACERVRKRENSRVKIYLIKYLSKIIIIIII